MSKVVDNAKTLKQLNHKLGLLLKQFQKNQAENAFISAKLQAVLEDKQAILVALEIEGGR